MAGLHGAAHVGPNTRDDVWLKRVFCTSTDALKRGYPVCYDRDNTTALDHTGTAIAATSASWARHRYVEKPAAGNLNWFAGFVARDYAANASGQFIDILVPFGGVYEVWTAANCTANSTKLSLTAAAWTLGDGDGPIVAEALQTVDRSSTNGLVQAVCYRTRDDATGEYGADAGSVPSRTIWSNLPSVADLIRNPSLGIWWDSRYGSSWTSNADSNAVIESIAGGGISLFVTADNEECGIIGHPGGFRIGSGAPPLGFEARFKVSSITAADGTFVGLTDRLLAATNFLNDTGAVLVNTDASIGLSIPEGDPNGGDVCAIEVSGTQVNFDTDAVVPVADTYVNFGMYYNGTDVITYTNGTAIGDNITAAEIAATTFPTNISMQPVFWVKSGATTDFTATLAWMRVIQLAA